MAEIIDFLPSRYREQNVRRRSRIWLLSILGLFASVIAITSSIQLALHKQAMTQLAAIDFQYSSAQATQNMFNKLQANLASAKTSASLYASLDTDWPRTQILFAVVQPLTNEITISELTIAWETEQEGRSQTQARSRRRGTPEVEQQTGLPAKRDLDTLRQQRANQRTIVRLSGTTTDNVALHRYVSRLSNDPLFVNAELLSFETSDGHDALSADFLVRVIVRESKYGSRNESLTSIERQGASRRFFPPHEEPVASAIPLIYSSNDPDSPASKNAAFRADAKSQPTRASVRLSQKPWASAQRLMSATILDRPMPGSNLIGSQR